MEMMGGESLTGQSSRWSKKNSSSGTGSDYCKRVTRVLEPVLEHAELVICKNSSSTPGCETLIKSSSTGNGPAPLQQYCNRRGKGGKPGGLRILAKLRDGYVKLMNDVAMGADLGGVSSFYGAPCAGYGCPLAVDHSPVLSISPREPHLSPRRFATHNQSPPAASL